MSKPIYCVSDGQVTTETYRLTDRAEIAAEMLNLLAEIRDALVQRDQPGETIKRARRQRLEEEIGKAEALAALHRAAKNAVSWWISLPDGLKCKDLISQYEELAAALRAELERLEKE